MGRNIRVVKRLNCMYLTYLVVGRAGEQCLVPEAVSEIGCRRAKVIPANNDHLISCAPLVLYLVQAYSAASQTLLYDAS